MPDPVEVRRAARADRNTLLMFHRELYVSYRDAIVDPAAAQFYAYRDLEAALRDDVDAMLHSPLATVLLAERGPKPLGYITGHIETDERRIHPTKGIVGDWFVVESARNLGVGRRLMDALLQAFRDLGASVVESCTWPFNHLAREAHRRAGFVEVEMRYRRVLASDAPP